MQSARCADGVRPSATSPEVSLSRRCGAWSTSGYPAPRSRERRQSAFCGPMPGTVSSPGSGGVSKVRGSRARLHLHIREACEPACTCDFYVAFYVYFYSLACTLVDHEQ